MKLFSRIVLSSLLGFAIAATASAVTTNEPLGPNWFFQPPENLGPEVNSSYDESAAAISSDGLTLIFNSERPGGEGGPDLWQSTRATTSDPWTTSENPGDLVNSDYYESGPSLSADGLTLYFTSDRLGGHGDRDLWQSTHVYATTTPNWRRMG